MRKGVKKESEVECGRSGRRVEEGSSPPPIRELSCSDVCLAIQADGQIAANDMCWESSRRQANDRRRETGRWLPSGKYACRTIPMVYTKTARTFGNKRNKKRLICILLQTGRMLPDQKETITVLLVESI